MAKKGKELDGGSSVAREGTGAATAERQDDARLKTMRRVYTLDDKYRAEIGVMFENRDGSLSVLLNALPCNRKLWIPVRKDESQTQS